jgi:hypothetical protein
VNGPTLGTAGSFEIKKWYLWVWGHWGDSLSASGVINIMHFVHLTQPWH